MTCLRLLLVSLSLSAAVHGARRAGEEGNPVQKVIGLLERMESQIQAEGKAEAAAYDKFACFCKEQADEKTYRITKGKDKIAMLSSSIEVAEADIVKLNDETQSAKTDIDNLTTEMDSDAAQRGTDFEAFTKDREDLQGAIERLEDAIADLSGSKGKMSGQGVKTDLLAKGTQVSKAEKAVILEVDQALRAENQTETKKAAMIAKGVAAWNKVMAGGPEGKDLMSSSRSWQEAKAWRHRVLELIGSGRVRASKEQAEVFLQWSTKKQSPGGANAFEFSSNKHIDIIKELLKSYKQQMFARETREANDKHTYLMARQANQHSLDSVEKLKSKLETSSASKSEQKGADENEKGETTEDTEADQTFLDELTDDCEKKAKAWDARSKVRSSELTAISEALGVMKEGVVGNYKANKLGLVSKHAAMVQEEEDDEDDEEEDDTEEVSFLQRRKKRHLTGKDKHDRRKRVQELLSKEAKSLKDVLLSSLAMKVRGNNFGEVKKLIGDLIKKLEDEATSAADESAWCKDEMEAATTKRDENQATIEKKESAITLGGAKVVQLKVEVKEVQGDITELYKALNDQTQLRQADHAENEQTLLDTRAGLMALNAAKETLENFYNDPTALLEVDERRVSLKRKGPDADGKEVSDLAPKSESFTGENTGKQDEGKGIIALLTTIGTDFERTIESTEQGEEANEADFQTFKSDAEADIAEKKKSKDKKEGEIRTTEADKVQDGDALADAKDLKQNAIDELNKLKPICLDSGSSFQERKMRREQEIAALKEAMKIIDEL